MHKTTKASFDWQNVNGQDHLVNFKAKIRSKTRQSTAALQMWVTPPKILILYQLKYQLSIIYALFYHNLVVNDEMMTDEPERLGRIILMKK